MALNYLTCVCEHHVARVSSVVSRSFLLIREVSWMPAVTYFIVVALQ